MHKTQALSQPESSHSNTVNQLSKTKCSGVGIPVNAVVVKSSGMLWKQAMDSILPVHNRKTIMDTVRA